MIKIKVLLLLGFMICSTQVQAQEEKVEQTVSTNQEKWYINLGLGYPSITHPKAIQDFISLLKSLAETKNTPFEFDLGLYFPIHSNITLGASLSAAVDRYEHKKEWIQFTTEFYGASVLYHTKSQFDGFFVRGDIGSAKMNLQSDNGTNEDSDSGLGYLFGLGYSFPLHSKVRLVPYVNYFGTTIESEKYSKISFGVSVVF